MITSKHLSADELREKFLNFFESRGHKILPSSSLLPENDPSVLFTTAGMQQFKRFYLFPEEAPSVRIATCQKCVRTGDIDEVGDQTHLTFFEMLGNFSFGYPREKGSYFKKEAIEWAWEFLTKELEIDKSRIYATYFKDDAKEVPEDKESLAILQQVEGLDDIRPQGFGDNFWSLGTEGSPGGPTVEFYVDGVEVWNLVFNEFVLKNGTYEPSELKGIDTGMGLERLTAMMQGKSDVFQTDLFDAIISKIEEISGKKYDENQKEFRIIADHIRSAAAMIADGVLPSNKDQGYVLRRLIRRAIVQGRRIGLYDNFTDQLTDNDLVRTETSKEELKFRTTLEKGMRQFDIISGMTVRKNDEHWSKYEIDANQLFDLYQTYGMPIEVTAEIALEKDIPIKEGAIGLFEVMKKNHQQKSRTASSGMFKGGLADNKVETTRLHTAAHLLLAALRDLLSEDIEQKGSNITEERLRFDFNYPSKLTDEQIKEIEDLVNQKISEALPIKMQEMSLDEAKTSGATGSFHDRYGDKVKIFTIGKEGEQPFSREICGGPHVENISQLGQFKIIKEESSSAGVRRIKAILQ
ncbi:MAG: Alanine--tRNA ligase [candidate division WS2 bacterium ADurb.Bin280]|uniref:alanine--tRNA ligase n=1 Tax=candidate division WS2 bacterium ADurb.Bin280 TaxID=1852829 RepID=A0A1V5SBB6_9BACT|nr:MAG: Alanine--tRNA ligase [candidate division WS2 bacterium ADurb.Bin280]